MNDNSARSSKIHVRFNERVQVTTIHRPAEYSTWYNADDFTKFRTDRRREIEALKQNCGEATRISCRGNEQIIFQPSQLRVTSRAIFVRKVLDQQDYESMKTNADSRMEDRLAAKVRRWSMASVDQAIMRAHLDAENDPVNWQHSTLVHDVPTSVKKSLLTTKAQIVSLTYQPFKENIAPTCASSLQGLTLRITQQTAACA